MDDTAAPLDLRAASRYASGALVIDTAQRQVLVAGEPARLGARAFDVLLALLERRDRVVSKRELLELVWPRLVVEENNLQVQIVALRKLLGPQAIATIPGRGYRFTLPVQPQGGAPAAPVAPRARGNLPAAPPLLGRGEELRTLTALVQRQPVVTIVGAGGIGKTRLAVAVAAALGDGDFVDGRWWVELAGVTDGARVPEAIAAALGQVLPAERPALPALVAALAGQRCLLVLDNCEHLADAVAGIVDRLRASAPSVHVLVTSQELLKCADEQAWRLGTLAVPAEARLEDALQYGAVALFVERAHAVAPRFALAEDNVAAVIDICRRLDGIPLAIELAAARVPLLGVQGLHARLDQMFNVLTGASRLALRRHQTLRAALEWSHGLLSAEERAVFRRLGVFAGGFPMALAQRVASDAGIDAVIDEWQVLDVLGHLIDKSLVIAGDEVEPRYRLLEPTRAYALEQLAAAGESDALFRRHAEAVLALLEDDDRQRWVAPQAERLRIVAEIGNVRAAVDWALAAGERRLACRLFGTGWTVWASNNASSEALERMRRLLPVPADLPARDEAAFCVALTRVRMGSGRDEFLAAALRAVALYRELGDRDRLADALIYFVGVAASRNEPTDIGDALDEAEALLGPAPPPRRAGSFAAAKGAWLLRQHRYAEALAVYEHQAAVYRSAGNTMGECLAAVNRANVLLDAADYDGAVQAARFAVEGLERLKAPYGRYPALGFLVQGQAMRGDAVDLRPVVRDLFNRFRGTDAVGPEIMATALHYARAGDAPRAGLLAGWARGAVGRSKAYPCPIDVHMRTRLRELLPAEVDDATLEHWQQAGERLTEVQVIAVAFDEAELAPLLP